MTQLSFPYRGIIFDLDGTLLNTEEGILSSVRHTIQAMGYAPLSEDVMRSFIGPPVKRSLMNAYGLDEAEADKATNVFRERYKNHDLLRAAPYEGITELLHRLRQAGLLLGVATLKREDYACTILEHFKLAPYFHSICGSDFASKMQKSDVLDKCMKELGIPPQEAVLIGDTASDSTGAKESGVDFIAVTYGFGPADKSSWASHRPVFTAEAPMELANFLLP